MREQEGEANISVKRVAHRNGKDQERGSDLSEHACFYCDDFETVYIT
jgi:hypothetical protein